MWLNFEIWPNIYIIKGKVKKRNKQTKKKQKMYKNTNNLEKKTQKICLYIYIFFSTIDANYRHKII